MRKRTFSIAMILGLVLSMTTLFAGIVSAHNVTTVGVDVSCTNAHITVNYTDFSGGHYVETTIVVNGGTPIVEDSAALNGAGTLEYDVALSGDGPFDVTVSAQAKLPNGTNEGTAVTGEGTHDSGCTPPPPLVLTPVLTCGGTFAFSNVPEDFAQLIVEPGDHLYTATTGFSDTLDPAVYTWEFRTATGGDIEGSSFTIYACPPAPPVTACGGTASWTNVPAGWYLKMDSSDVPITDNFDSVSLDPGKHHFQWYAADGTEMTGDNASGDFTISVCPKPVIIVTSPSCGKIDVNANQDAITAGLTVEVSLPVVGQGVEVGVLSGFSVGDNVSNVDPGTWTYTVGTGTDVSTFQALNPSITGQLTVTTCVTPQPLLPVVKTQCGGKIIVTFDDNFVTSDVVAPNAVVSSSPSDWMVVINPGGIQHFGAVYLGDAAFKLGDNVLSVKSGGLTWELRYNNNGTWTDELGGKVDWSVCRTPPPTGTAALSSNDSPSNPLPLVLLLGSVGAAFIYLGQRRRSLAS
jgi:hypothetical protein